VPGTRVGTVRGLWRYPVKSFLGEILQEADFAESGMLGDRASALVDTETGRVVSAKNPKRWPRMFQMRAAYVSPPTPGSPLPMVRFTFANRPPFTADDPSAEAHLSEVLGRPVTISHGVAGAARVEEFSPDLTGREGGGVSEFTARSGPFFDAQPVHLVTTGSLARLAAAHPAGRFDPCRFRPNILVESEEPEAEVSWPGRTLSIGDAMQLDVTRPCGRCVMTTLAQGDLPEELAILRTAVSLTKGKVGVYGTVARPGPVRVGDPVTLS